MSEPATTITIQNVSKTFRLPHEKNTSLKSAVVNFRPHRKKYELQKALENINFDVKQGEFFGIIGRNGSGKSTLLKLLAGIYTPSQGRVAVHGKLTPFIELGVGFNPELTGRENVFLNGALLGFNRKQMQRMYKDIVAFAELERFMDQKLKNYSSGMQVRLAFSIAIRAESDILLIDEVLAVGDQNFQDKCFRYFADIKQSGKTVVLISHDGSVIEKYCDRVAIIDQGQLVDIGDPREMVFQYGAIMANEQYQKEKGSTASKAQRQGTGVLAINKTEVIGRKKAPTQALEFGEPFAVRVHFKLNKKLPTPVVLGVDIIDESGTSVLGPNTQEGHGQTLTLKKSGYFDAAFASNPLSPGKYSLTVAIFNEQTTFAYELVENALQFKIIGEPTHGKIYIEPRWSVSDSA